ncbi:hypothetical protein [Bdellovibrio sp. HCB-162]|uniref:hypothetical protein n=1 Tax=Bdellovibrio sp. HCB-162 TaxID=3394234 RepID=UPI0039BC78A5
MEINRLEIIQSYITARNLLGLTNTEKNQIVSLSFEETATELFIKNGLTNKKLLLLKRKIAEGGDWKVSTTYSQLEPLAFYLMKELRVKTAHRSTERCMMAIEQLFDYKN